MEFLLCECGRAFRITEGEEDLPPGTEWEERKSGKECIQKSHKTTLLSVLPDSFISEKSLTQVVKTLYFYAKDEAGKIWVIRQERTGPGRDYSCKGFQGRIDKKVVFLAVQKDALAKQLRSDAKGAGFEINEKHVELFICFFENQLKFDRLQERLKHKNVSISNEHPLKIIVPLPGWMANSLVEFCQKFFPEEQKKFIKDFVDREKGGDGVLAFVGRRKFEIIHY